MYRKLHDLRKWKAIHLKKKNSLINMVLVEWLKIPPFNKYLSFMSLYLKKLNPFQHKTALDLFKMNSLFQSVMNLRHFIDLALECWHWPWIILICILFLCNSNPYYSIIYLNTPPNKKKSCYAFDFILYIKSRIKCKWIVLDVSFSFWSIDLVT